MKKKIVLSLALAVMLMGCGSQGKSLDTSESSSGATGDVYVISEDTTHEATTPNAETAPDEIEGDYDVVLPGGAPMIDAEGLDSFDQVIDTKLESGMGYAKLKLGDTDVLLVSSGCFDLDGKNAAIDSSFFIIGEDGKVTGLGGLDSSGTGYPVVMKGDCIYFATPNSVAKYTVKDGLLSLVLLARTEFDSEDNATNYVNDGNEEKEVPDYSLIDGLVSEMQNADVVEFTVK